MREDRGLSVEELADRSELSFRGLLYIEHGRRNPGLLTVFKIAEGLGIGVAELFADGPRYEASDPSGR
jgi:transcriptional regulator with XRE-family HTH domain